VANERKASDTSRSLIPDLEVRAKVQAEATPPVAGATVDPSPANTVKPVSEFASDVQDYFGSGNFDADHFGDVHANLETVDVVGGAAALLARTWPTGTTPDSTALVVDPVEVRLAADYGPPPKNAFSSPFYAVRVARRRGELEASTKQLSGALSEAEQRRDELLVATALELRGKVLLVEGGEDLFAPVVEIERLALERRSSLAGTNAEYDRRARELEERAQGVREEAARTELEVERAAQALAKQRETLERVMAKKKRLYIEIRGIMEAAEKSGGGFSASQSARIAELESAVASHGPEVERCERDVGAAETLLASAEADGKQVGRRLIEAERRQGALDEEFQKQIGVRAEGVHESERARVQALSEVMRKILAARGDIVEVPQESLESIAKADQAVHARALELEKFLRALDAFDYDAYGRGRVIIGVAIALVIAVIVVALF
jgi:hypothetical protein